MIDPSEPSPHVRVSYSFATPDEMDRVSAIYSLVVQKKELHEKQNSMILNSIELNRTSS